MPRSRVRHSPVTIEEPVKAKCLALLRAAGWYAEKVHGEAMQTRGTLDILSCVEGRLLTLEGKRHGEHLTPLQKYTAGRIYASGGWAAPVRDAELVRVMLEVGITHCCRFCLTPLVHPDSQGIDQLTVHCPNANNHEYEELYHDK